MISIVTSLVFERRTFCRYLCPVGGFIGLYSQAAPIELRVKDRDVCRGHREKTCYTGSDDGYGCPWLLFPGNLDSNTFCGLCTECLKTCPKDNVAIFVRRPGGDLMDTTGRRLDEAYKGLIMLGAAFVYSLVLIGPYGWLKETARAVGAPGWLAYAAAFLAFNLAALPGLFWLCVRLGERLLVRLAGALRPFWVGLGHFRHPCARLDTIPDRPGAAVTDSDPVGGAGGSRGDGYAYRSPAQTVTVGSAACVPVLRRGHGRPAWFVPGVGNATCR
jgi:hypothetical protein